MLDRIQRFAAQIERSDDFTCVYLRGKPVKSEKGRMLEETLRNIGQVVPESLLSFYNECDGLTFRWLYKPVTHPDYLIGGDVEFDSMDLLISRIYPSEPFLFDRVNETNQTMLELGPTGIRLLYYDEYSHQDIPLPIDLDRYFDLLDVSRALHPWRELIANSPSLPVEPARREHFASALSLLFGEADASAFLAEVHGRP